MRACAALLRGNNRSQHAIDRGVQSLDDRMVVVEPRAVDLDDELRARLVERVALQLLDRLADHLAIQVAGAGAPLEAGKGRLVRRSTGVDHESAAPGRAREALRERLLRSTHGDPGADARSHFNLAVEQHRAVDIGLRGRVRDQRRGLPRLLEQDRTGRVLEDRSQLHELGYERAQPARGRQPRRRQWHRHPRPRDADRERSEIDRPSGPVTDVHECVRLISRGGEEP